MCTSVPKPTPCNSGGQQEHQPRNRLKKELQHKHVLQSLLWVRSAIRRETCRTPRWPGRPTLASLVLPCWHHGREEPRIMLLLPSITALTSPLHPNKLALNTKKHQQMTGTQSQSPQRRIPTPACGGGGGSGGGGRLGGLDGGSSARHLHVAVRSHATA